MVVDDDGDEIQCGGVWGVGGSRWSGCRIGRRGGSLERIEEGLPPLCLCNQAAPPAKEKARGRGGIEGSDLGRRGSRMGRRSGLEEVGSKKVRASSSVVVS